MKRKILSCVLSICMVITMMPSMAFATGEVPEAEPETTSVTEPVELDLTDGSLFITETGYTQGDAAEETAHTGSYVLTQSSTQTTGNSVSVTSGTHEITADGLNIKRGGSGLSVSGNAAVTLTLKGENIFQSDTTLAAVYIAKGSSLTIRVPDGEADSYGTLTAKNDKNDAAAIGGSRYLQAGTLNIESGTVNATKGGGANAGAIGPGNQQSMEKISISGGIVNAKSGGGAVPMGGSLNGITALMEISGGTITADKGMKATKIYLTGGYVDTSGLDGEVVAGGVFYTAKEGAASISGETEGTTYYRTQVALWDAEGTACAGEEVTVTAGGRDFTLTADEDGVISYLYLPNTEQTVTVKDGEGTLYQAVFTPASAKKVYAVPEGLDLTDKCTADTASIDLTADIPAELVMYADLNARTFPFSVTMHKADDCNLPTSEHAINVSVKVEADGSEVTEGADAYAVAEDGTLTLKRNGAYTATLTAACGDVTASKVITVTAPAEKATTLDISKGTILITEEGYFQEGLSAGWAEGEDHALTITGTAEYGEDTSAATNFVRIKGGDPVVTLENLTIHQNPQNGNNHDGARPAILLDTEQNATLLLEGTSRLYGGFVGPAIQINRNADLVIKDGPAEGVGKLYATGGGKDGASCAIGSGRSDKAGYAFAEDGVTQNASYGNSGNTLTIESGEIHGAISTSTQSSIIGCSWNWARFGRVTIKGGTLVLETSDNVGVNVNTSNNSHGIVARAVTIEGGKIVRNLTGNGYGVAIHDHGTFKMTGGTFTEGNSQGGGRIADAGTYDITGGNLNGCFKGTETNGRVYTTLYFKDHADTEVTVTEGSGETANTWTAETNSEGYIYTYLDAETTSLSVKIGDAEEAVTMPVQYGWGLLEGTCTCDDLDGTVQVHAKDTDLHATGEAVSTKVYATYAAGDCTSPFHNAYESAWTYEITKAKYADGTDAKDLAVLEDGVLTVQPAVEKGEYTVYIQVSSGPDAQHKLVSEELAVSVTSYSADAKVLNVSKGDIVIEETEDGKTKYSQGGAEKFTVEAGTQVKILGSSYGNNEEAGALITIKGGAPNLLLSGVTMDNGLDTVKNRNRPLITLWGAADNNKKAAAEATITLEGRNRLVAGSEAPAIHVARNATLTLDGEDSLDTETNGSLPAIGTAASNSYSYDVATGKVHNDMRILGNLHIKNGTYNLKIGNVDQGLGRNGNNPFGNITIDDGTITIKKDDTEYGSIYQNGNAASGKITINGGTINARQIRQEVTNAEEAMLEINGATLNLSLNGDAVYTNSPLSIKDTVINCPAENLNAAVKAKYGLTIEDSEITAGWMEGCFNNPQPEGQKVVVKNSDLNLYRNNRVLASTYGPMEITGTTITCPETNLNAGIYAGYNLTLGDVTATTGFAEGNMLGSQPEGAKTVVKNSELKLHRNGQVVTAAWAPLEITGTTITCPEVNLNAGIYTRYDLTMDDVTAAAGFVEANQHGTQPEGAKSVIKNSELNLKRNNNVVAAAYAPMEITGTTITCPEANTGAGIYTRYALTMDDVTATAGWILGAAQNPQLKDDAKTVIQDSNLKLTRGGRVALESSFAPMEITNTAIHAADGISARRGVTVTDCENLQVMYVAGCQDNNIAGADEKTLITNSTIKTPESRANWVIHSGNRALVLDKVNLTCGHVNTRIANNNIKNEDVDITIRDSKIQGLGYITCDADTGNVSIENSEITFPETTTHNYAVAADGSIDIVDSVLTGKVKDNFLQTRLAGGTVTVSGDKTDISGYAGNRPVYSMGDIDIQSGNIRMETNLKDAWSIHSVEGNVNLDGLIDLSSARGNNGIIYAGGGKVTQTGGDVRLLTPEMYKNTKYVSTRESSELSVEVLGGNTREFYKDDAGRKETKFLVTDAEGAILANTKVKVTMEDRTWTARTDDGGVITTYLTAGTKDTMADIIVYTEDGGTEYLQTPVHDYRVVLGGAECTCDAEPGVFAMSLPYEKVKLTEDNHKIQLDCKYTATEACSLPGDFHMGYRSADFYTIEKVEQNGKPVRIAQYAKVEDDVLTVYRDLNLEDYTVFLSATSEKGSKAETVKLEIQTSIADGVTDGIFDISKGSVLITETGYSQGLLTYRAGEGFVVLDDKGKKATEKPWTEEAHEVIVTGNYTYSADDNGNNTIVIAGGNPVVTLHNLSITQNVREVPGMVLLSGTEAEENTATVVLKGESSLSGGDQAPGIQISRYATLTIEGEGILNAKGRNNTTGVGAPRYATYAINKETGLRDNASRELGNVIINSGIVNITGANGGGSGIGASWNVLFGDVTINGGVVTANCPGNGPAIATRTNSGNYNLTGGKVTINGGQLITATADNGGNANLIKGDGGFVMTGGILTNLMNNAPEIQVSEGQAVSITGGNIGDFYSGAEANGRKLTKMYFVGEDGTPIADTEVAFEDWSTVTDAQGRVITYLPADAEEVTAVYNENEETESIEKGIVFFGGECACSEVEEVTWEAGFPNEVKLYADTVYTVEAAEAVTVGNCVMPVHPNMPEVTYNLAVSADEEDITDVSPYAELTDDMLTLKADYAPYKVTLTAACGDKTATHIIDVVKGNPGDASVIHVSGEDNIKGIAADGGNENGHILTGNAKSAELTVNADAQTVKLSQDSANNVWKITRGEGVNSLTIDASARTEGKTFVGHAEKMVDWTKVESGQVKFNLNGGNVVINEDGTYRQGAYTFVNAKAYVAVGASIEEDRTITNNSGEAVEISVNGETVTIPAGEAYTVPMAIGERTDSDKSAASYLLPNGTGTYRLIVVGDVNTTGIGHYGGAAEKMQEKITEVWFDPDLEVLDGNILNYTVNLQHVSFDYAKSVNCLYSCRAKTINFGPQVENISWGNYMTNLQSVTVDADNQFYKVADGALYTMDEKTLVGIPAMRTGSHKVLSECEKIGNVALYGSNLDTITFGSSLRAIGSRAFEAAKIKAVNVVGDNPYYESVDGVLFDEQMKTLLYYPPAKADKNYTIPDGVTKVVSFGLASNYNLEELTLPDNNITADRYGFLDLQNLKKLTVQENFPGNFAGAKNLTTLVVPEEYNWATNAYGADSDKSATTMHWLPSAKVAVSKEDFTYDGTPKTGVTVSQELEDVTIEYSKDNQTWSSEAPTFTQPGTHTVYFRLTKAADVYTDEDRAEYSGACLVGERNGKFEFARSVYSSATFTIKDIDKPTADWFDFTPAREAGSENMAAGADVTLAVGGVPLTAEGYEVQYYDSEGQLLDAVPETAGTYTVKVNITEELYKAYDLAPIELGTYSITEKGIKAISFVTNGGSAIDTITAEPGAEITVPDDPERMGYAFLGWYADSALRTKIDALPETMPEENTAYYAKWKRETYTITYDNMKGAVTANPVTYTTESDDIVLEAPSVPGYEFTGWTYDDHTEETAVIEKGSTGDKIFSANWKPAEYTITYKNYVSGTDVYTLTDTKASGIKLNIPTDREGYTFAGWQMSNNNVVTIIPLEKGQIPKGTLGDLIISGIWLGKEQTLTLDAGEGAFADGSKTHVITNEYDGSINLDNPVREGYDFAGWFEDEACTIPFDAETMPLTMTIHAKWLKQITDCEVTLDTDTYAYDGKMKTPAVTVKDNEKVLTEGTDYTVAYAEGRQEIGSYKITVNFMGEYVADSRDVYFSITLPSPEEVKAEISQSTGKPYITWAPVEGAVKYVLLIDTEEGYRAIGSTTGTSINHRSAVPETGYSYRIQAVEQNGFDSQLSEEAVITCPYAKPVIKVSNNETTGKPVISWSKVEGASRYDLYMSTGGEYKKIGYAAGTSITHRSAEAGKLYYYKIKAVGEDEALTSVFSARLYTRCRYAKPVIKVSNNETTGKPVISWSKVEGVSRYDLYMSTGGDYKRIGYAEGTGITHKSAEPGKLYYYKVKAAGSNSNADSAFSARVYSRCAYAKPVIEVGLNSAGKPVISWTKVEGATGYELWMSTGGEYKKIGSTTGASITHRSAESGRLYYYKIKATGANSSAASAFSDRLYIRAK